MNPSPIPNPNPEHINIALDPNPNPNPNPTRSKTYKTIFFQTQIKTTVTSTPAVVRQWVYTLRNTHRESLSNSNLIIGLDIQRGPTSTASTLTLCVGSDCLIFQLAHAKSVPETLRRLLKDERVTFVGVHNTHDEKALMESKLTVWDLVDLAEDEGFGDMRLEGIASEVLGLPGFVNTTKAKLSGWDGEVLSDAHVQYACVNAHVCYAVGVKLGYAVDGLDDEDDDDDDGDLEFKLGALGLGGLGGGGKFGRDGMFYDDSKYGCGYFFDDDGEYVEYDDYTNPFNYDSDGSYIG